MIPLGELTAELVLAVGGALFAANLWVLLRPIVQRPKKGETGTQTAVDDPRLRQPDDRGGRLGLGHRHLGDASLSLTDGWSG